MKISETIDESVSTFALTIALFYYSDFLAKTVDIPQNRKRGHAVSVVPPSSLSVASS